MAHIFISYSHKDSSYAHKLAESLELKNFIVWIDDRIDYGSTWPHVIQEHLDSCTAFIVIMSPNSYQSDWVQNELNRAKRKNKPIFPLLLDGNEPWLSVEATQFVDVRGSVLPPIDFYERLNQVIAQRIEKPVSQYPPLIPEPSTQTMRLPPLETLQPSRLPFKLQEPVLGLLIGAIAGILISINMTIDLTTVSVGVCLAGIPGMIGGLLVRRYRTTKRAKIGFIAGAVLGIVMGFSTSSYVRGGDTLLLFITRTYWYMFIFAMVGWSIGRLVSPKTAPI
jgi:hypothetical protein